MNPIMILISALVGYLAGSISFARIIKIVVSPQSDISKITHPVPQSDIIFESNSISATAVRVNMGTRYGCLTAILDMLKVATPTLVFLLLYPDMPYFLFSAAMGHVGHDFPIYHGFRGGRGESPIYGGLLVIDWLGVLVTNILGCLLGMVIGSILILRWGGLVLMIPWMWFRTHDWFHLGYIIFVNALYWITMSPELRQYFKLLKSNINPSEEDVADFMGMGKPLGRFMDKYSIMALVNKIKRR